MATYFKKTLFLCPLCQREYHPRDARQKACKDCLARWWATYRAARLRARRKTCAICPCGIKFVRGKHNKKYHSSACRLVAQRTRDRAYKEHERRKKGVPVAIRRTEDERREMELHADRRRRKVRMKDPSQRAKRKKTLQEWVAKNIETVRARARSFDQKRRQKKDLQCITNLLPPPSI